MNAATTTDSQAIIIPTYDELRKEFDWVSDGFKGKATDWLLYDSCKGVPTADPDACELIYFGKSMSDQAALDSLKSRGLRPTTLAESLAWARKNPDKQKEHPIVCLGFSCLWRGRRFVPSLYWSVNERCLDLLWRGHVHHACYDFLAVRV